jgi:hypothetical protein
MNWKNSLQELVQYFTEGFARIFSPNKDEYPDVGSQPFEAEPYHTPKKES